MTAAQDLLQTFTQARLPSLCSASGEACMGPPSSDAAASFGTAVAAASPLYEHTALALDAQPDVAIEGPGDGISSYLAPLLGALQSPSVVSRTQSRPCLEKLPNEVLVLVASFLDVDDLLHTSRTCRRLRSIFLDPVIHQYRLRNSRLVLAPLLSSPRRPSLSELMSRSIFLTNNTVISRRLARSLVSIRLARCLAARPTPESLAQRAVLPRECVPGMVPVPVAPGLVARRKAIEKERLKDGLRRWVACKWKGEVKEREEDAKRCDESRGVGRVWRLRRYWERVSQGDMVAH